MIHPSRRAAASAFFLLLFALPPRLAVATEIDDAPSTVANRLLRDACTFLASLASFQFEVDAIVGERLPSGQIVHRDRSSLVTVRRPDRIHVEMTDHRGTHLLWYDGTRVVIYRGSDRSYMETATPGSVDETLDFLAREFGFAPPLVDLLYSDPYAVLTEKSPTATWLGVTWISGRRVHHLACAQASIHWEIWIDDGPQPLIRRFALTHAGPSENPTYLGHIKRWALSPPIPDSAFVPFLPESAAPVEPEDLLNPREKKSEP